MTRAAPSLVARGMRAAAAACVVLSVAGCRPTPPVAPDPSPHASLLTVAGELRRFSVVDFYRHPYPLDLSGLNAFHAALVRLQNFEALHPGRQTEVVSYLRGEALLCLQDYEAAARAYEGAMRGGTELADPARARRAAALEFAEATVFPEGGGSLADAMDTLHARRGALKALVGRHPERPLRTLAEIEAEQADVDWARAVTHLRTIQPRGLEAAIAAWVEVVEAHAQSRRRMSHKLALGSLYDEVAREYVEAHPATSARFEAEVFERLANRARALYLEVGEADGFAEKLVARARLEALNASVRDALGALP